MPESARRLDPAEGERDREPHGLRGQNFGACTFAVGFVYNSYVVQKHLWERKWSLYVERVVTFWHCRPRVYLSCNWSAGGGWLEAKKTGGISGSFGFMGLSTGDRTLGAFMHACRWLSASRALLCAFMGCERGGQTGFNSPGSVDLQPSLSSNRRPSKCMVAWDRCRAVFGAIKCDGISE